jgi:hypothetical protein
VAARLARRRPAWQRRGLSRGDLEARSGSGDVTAGRRQGRGVSTGSGDVEVTGATGPVRAPERRHPVEGTPVRVGGQRVVRRRAPAGGGQSGFDLDRATPADQTSHPITVTGRSHAATQRTGRGGGPLVHVTTSAGAILIQ